MVGGAPWTRNAIRQYRHRYPEATATLEARIPDGMSVLIIADRRPGQWGAVLTTGWREIARTERSYPTITAAAYAAIHAGEVLDA